MVNLVPDEIPLKSALRGIEQLAAYATAYRYPTPAGRILNAPSATELEALLELVNTALNEAVQRFGVELAKKGAPAARSHPIR